MQQNPNNTTMKHTKNLNKMTAVEFLKSELENISKSQVEWHEAFNKALEMEWQQIINAKDCWFEDERDGEQYYNETYKK